MADMTSVDPDLMSLLSLSPSRTVGAKISATSSAGGAIGLTLHDRLQGLDRTDHLRRISVATWHTTLWSPVLVTEQHLDNPDIYLLFQANVCKAVPLMASSALEA